MVNFKKISLKGKGCLLGCLGIVVLFIVATGLHFLNSFFGDPPSKDEIKKTVIENNASFDRAVSIIRKMDKHVYAINHTKYYPAENNLEIKGLFTSKTVNTECVQTPIKNGDLEKLFLKDGVQGIDVFDNSIEFFFGGFWRDYYCGAIWTFNGKPVGFQGENMELVPLGKGWEYKEAQGDNRYYTEKIIDNWYFYEMSF